jgi:hypothetical protein
LVGDCVGWFGGHGDRGGDGVGVGCHFGGGSGDIWR